MPLGIPNARFFADGDTGADDPGRHASARARDGRRSGAEGKNPTRTNLPPVYYLAVSGGGDNGAFGAGLLNGWSETGTRPEFKMVTGVSTGALIAPVRLPRARLRCGACARSTRRMTPDEHLSRRGASSPPCSTTPWPTRRRLPTSSPSTPMRRCSPRSPASTAKGRLLLIGTTDLDAQRPVIWNIGALAASGKPEALRALPQDPARLGGDPGRLPAGDDRRRARRPQIPGDACRRRRHRPALPLSAVARGRPPDEARAPRLHHPQRPARSRLCSWPSAGPSPSPAAPSAPCWPPAATTTCCAPTSSASATASTTTSPT